MKDHHPPSPAAATTTATTQDDPQIGLQSVYARRARRHSWSRRGPQNTTQISSTMSSMGTGGMDETNGGARLPAKRQASAENGPRNGSRRRNDLVPAVTSDTEGSWPRKSSARVPSSAASRKRSRNGLRDASADAAEARIDDSPWIHRDKLAQIEIQEMEEAGIHVRLSRRSTSAEPGARPGSRPQSRTGSVSKEPGEARSHPKRVSTIPAGNEEEEAGEEEEEYEPLTVDTQFGKTHEAGMEPSSPESVARPGTSRIPVSKVSPVPVSHNVVGRESPLPRSQHGRSGPSGNWDELTHARRRRNPSMGSQNLLDEDGDATPSQPGTPRHASSTENSPPKSRLPSRPTPSSGAKKTPTPGLSKSASRTAPNQRPTSRSGHKSRPSTGHQQAPEGTAPWEWNMYKPDPRLPPDQQMLPTHARRMMQEQWEREGHTGTAYDRDLRLLNNDAFPAQPAKDRDHEGESARADAPGGPSSPTNPDAPWPSPSAKPVPSVAPPRQSSTGGGYGIVPTIASPRATHSPSPPQPSGSTHSETPPSPPPHSPSSPPRQAGVTRMPGGNEKDGGDAEGKKGCGCCIVM